MRTGLFAAVVAGVGLLALAHVATPVDAQVKIKTGCPNVIAARCPKNQHRECRQTNSKGCCTKSACVQN